MNPRFVTFFRIMLVLMIAAILLFAFAPGVWTPAWVVNHDKFSHFLAFFVLFIVVKLSFPRVNNIIPICLLIFLTILIESLQLILFQRGFSNVDIYYGFFGIFISLIFYQLAGYCSNLYNNIKANE